MDSPQKAIIPSYASEKLELEPWTDCTKIKDYVGPDWKKYKQDSIRKNFKLNRELPEGRSGAYPALVTHIKSGKTYFLKVLPAFSKLPLTNLKKNKWFREAYHTCMLSKLHYKGPNKEFFYNFPIFYGVFLTDALMPFASKKHANQTHVAILTEAIDGMHLLNIASDPEKAQKQLGLHFSTNKESLTASIMKKNAEILYQLIKALSLAQATLNFTHNDIHAANILISKNENESIRIVITDPGIAESNDYPRELRILKEKNLNRVMMKENLKFSLKLTKIHSNPNFFLGLKKIKQLDIRAYNVLLKSMRSSIGATKSETPTCINWEKCRTSPIFQKYKLNY